MRDVFIYSTNLYVHMIAYNEMYYYAWRTVTNLTNDEHRYSKNKLSKTKIIKTHTEREVQKIDREASGKKKNEKELERFYR